MAKSNNLIIIAIIVVTILFVMQGERKEAVIPDYVEPDSSVSVMGELRVKDDATSFTVGQPAKVHWSICPDELCVSVTKSGYETLTSAEITDLNDQLDDPAGFRTVIYYMDFIAPSTAGTYYYEGTAETATGLRILQIDLDSNINFVHSNRFVVVQITDDPCIDYTDEEIISIANGDIRVTVRHIMTGTQPDCTEVSRNDIGFQVLCDSGYEKYVNGRESTCTKIITDICPDGKITTSCVCRSEVRSSGVCCDSGNEYQSNPDLICCPDGFIVTYISQCAALDCTPGETALCIGGGVKTCKSDGTWGTCITSDNPCDEGYVGPLRTCYPSLNDGTCDTTKCWETALPARLYDPDCTLSDCITISNGICDYAYMDTDPDCEGLEPPEEECTSDADCDISEGEICKENTCISQCLGFIQVWDKEEGKCKASTTAIIVGLIFGALIVFKMIGKKK